MEAKKEKLVIDGNAVYELDLECLREREKKYTKKKTDNNQAPDEKRNGVHTWRYSEKNGQRS